MSLYVWKIFHCRGGTGRTIVKRFLLGLFLACALTEICAHEAQAVGYPVPLITVACHFNPEISYPRANGYDCVAAKAAKHDRVVVDSQLSDLERTLVINRAFNRLALSATADCGPSCRFFYGTMGGQCLAIAQSARFTGLGSFMGRELTREDSEATALRDCRDYVGTPGEECRIIVSECPQGIGR